MKWWPLIMLLIAVPAQAQYGNCPTGQAVIGLNGPGPVVCGSVAGSGSPSNPTGSLQYNNSGVFGGVGSVSGTMVTGIGINGCLNVATYATGGTGTQGNPWTGWDTQTPWAANTCFLFPSGNYFTWSTTFNLAFTGIRLVFGEQSVLYYTGTGNGLDFDSGAVSGGNENISVEGSPIILGANTSGAGIYLRGIHHSTFEHPRIFGFQNCIETHFTVVDVFYQPECSVNAPYNALVAGIPTPVNGIVLSDRNGTPNTTTTIIEPIIEGLTGNGIDNQGNTTVVIGGTSESNNVNVLEEGFRSTYIGLDMESGVSNDVVDTGRLARFIDVLSGSSGAAAVHVESGANSNAFVGGQYGGLTIDAGAKATTLENFQYACATGPVNNGSDTSIINLMAGCATGDLGGIPTVFPQFQIPSYTYSALTANLPCGTTNGTVGVEAILLNDGSLCTFGTPATAAAGAATISERGTANTVSQSTSSTITITKPTGTTTGDVLVAHIWTSHSGGTAPAVTLAGWTKLDSSPTTCGSGSNTCHTTLYRVSDGTDGANYAFNFSSSADFSAGAVSAWVNVDNSVPIDAHSIRGQQTAAQIFAPSVTTDVNGSMLVAQFFDLFSNVVLTTPSGFSSIWTIADAGNSDSGRGANMTQSTSGATGNINTSGNTPGDNWGSSLIALRPAGAGYVCKVGCVPNGSYLAGY